HLRLFELLVLSYHSLPPGTDLMARAGEVAGFGSFAFASGLMLALPVAAVLLMVNLLLAVVARSAPQLNLFSIGFPTLMLAGIVALALALPATTATMAGSIETLQDRLQRLFLR
ncbi:MAG: flagellar biosynthetic protein FliR, partial [Janthinobacterium lividum]